MARKLFEKQGIRTRSGALATGTVYVVYTDAAGTVLADVSATSGGSAIAGSTVTVTDLATLGLATLRFYGPTDGTDTLYLRCPADTSLGVQELEADEDERLDALEAGGGGSVATHAAASDPHPGYVLESLYDAKGDLLPASAADTPAKLTVGANDTVLTADSSTGTGLKWATPAAGGIPATLLDAKGDLIGATANDTAARLAVGSNGQMLQADSAQSTGLKWSTAPVVGTFPQTFSGNLATGVLSVLANNRGHYMLVTEGPVQSITTLLVYMNASSGNISVAVYSSTGTGRSRTPASRLATSGAIASPGTGLQTISLGGSVTVTPFETWFFLSADNTTASFAVRTGGFAAAMTTGLAGFEAAAHPAPLTAGALTGNAGGYWIAGA